MSDESDSEPPSQDRESSSVFDILYHDHRRIASFLAQFETYGVLQEVKAIEAVARSATTKTGLSAGVNVAVGKGQFSQDHQAGSEEHDSAERIYDPLWTNARTLLNYVFERDLIIRDVEKARIGQFVIVTGTLALFDLGLLKEAWKLPAIKDAILAAATQDALTRIPQSSNKQERSKTKYAAKKEVEDAAAGIELMKILPHTIQAAIREEERTIWASLREDSLVTPGSELMLKHGVTITGVWRMIGILDALPQNDENSTAEYLLDQLLGGSSLSGSISETLTKIGAMARMTLGRPADAYGMTPLLIFREVLR